MPRFSRPLGWAVLISIVWLWAPATRADPIRFYYISGAPPLSWQDEDGHARGTQVELLGFLAEKAGIAIEYHTMPWARAQTMVQHGELDGFVTVANEERLAYAKFNALPIFEVRQKIFHRYDDHRFDHLSDPAQLVGKMQLSALGTGSGQIFDPERLTKARTIDDMSKMLVGERGDYFISDSMIASAILRKNGLQGHIASSDAPFLKTLEFRIGLRKDFPDADRILGKFDAAIAAAKQSGELDRFLESR